MKIKLLLIAILPFLLQACSSSKSVSATSVPSVKTGNALFQSSEEKRARLLFVTIFNRETFIPPAVRSDYEIDYAMRLGLVPRAGEPKEASTDSMFLNWQMNGAAENLKKKKGVNKLQTVLNELCQEYGVNWWLVEYSRRDPEVAPFVKGVMENPDYKKSTYYKLAMIKEERVKAGNWNP